MKYYLTMTICIVTFLSFSWGQIPTDSLLVYYRFNGDPSDFSGSHNSGIISGGVTWGIDRFGKPNGAVHFDGIDGLIISEDSISISGSQARTISCWINLDTLQWGSILGGWGNYVDKKLSFLKTFDGELYFHGHFADVRTGEVRVNPGEWNHVLFVYDGTNGKLFLNNTIVAEGGLDLQTDETRLRLGFDSYSDEGEYNQHLKGMLDDFRIYNKALSYAEIATLYNENGLVANYPFNNNANDESGNENDGTIIGGTTPTTDRFGKDSSAFLFDGSTGYVHVANSVSLQSPSTAITLCGWALLDSYNGGWDHIGFINKTMTSDYGEYHLMYHTWVYPQIYFSINGSPGNAGSVVNAPTDGSFKYRKWYFVATTWDGDTAKIFVDGKKLISTPLSGTISPDTNSLLLGLNGPGGNNFLKGKLDDVRIYNRALTEQEIKSLYGNYRQQIVSITDIPNDQGGKVRITWDKIYLDTTGVSSQIGSYGVWRKIPAEVFGKRAAFKSPFSIANDTLGTLYDYLGTVNAVQSPVYNFVAQTLADSDATDTHDETYLITAHTSDPNVYYISDPAMGHSVAQIQPVPILAGWNMVSIPLGVTNNQKDLLLPGALSSAFQYDGSYVTSENLEVGKGYWVKYESASSIPITGYTVDAITIPVNPGWNMIGTISSSLSIGEVMSNPGGIVTSYFYSYNVTYTTATTLEPGKAYWVKSNQTGFLILSVNATTSEIAKNQIRIVPVNELPPAPPGIDGGTTEVTPKGYILSQNYPNPFNPTTNIRYGIPENSYVTLSVFNTLGEQVALLVGGQQDAGYHEVTFNAEKLSSGVYFYRLQAGNYAETKKLLLMK